MKKIVALFCLLFLIEKSIGQISVLNNKEILPEVKVLVKDMPQIKTAYREGLVYDSLIYKKYNTIIAICSDSLTNQLIGYQTQGNYFKHSSFCKEDASFFEDNYRFHIRLFEDTLKNWGGFIRILIRKHCIIEVEQFDENKGMYYFINYNFNGKILGFKYDDLNKGVDYYFYKNEALNLAFNSKSGVLKRQPKMPYGIRNGISKSFHPNGKLKSEIYYEKGERKYIESAYDSLGKQLKLINVNSKGNGTCKIPWTYLMDIYPDSARVYNTDIVLKNYKQVGGYPQFVYGLPDYIVNTAKRKTKVCR